MLNSGSTTYVLSNHQGAYQLWNAHTGEKFSVNDAYCPLQNIACLINSENVSMFTDNLIWWEEEAGSSILLPNPIYSMYQPDAPMSVKPH